MKRYRLSPGSNFQVAVDVKRFRRTVDKMRGLKQLTADDSNFVFELTGEDSLSATYFEMDCDIPIYSQMNRSS